MTSKRFKVATFRLAVGCVVLTVCFAVTREIRQRALVASLATLLKGEAEGNLAPRTQDLADEIKADGFEQKALAEILALLKSNDLGVRVSVFHFLYFFQKTNPAVTAELLRICEDPSLSLEEKRGYWVLVQQLNPHAQRLQNLTRSLECDAVH
ncbi:hypothetical protein SAMN05421753_12111 [Planctomicrobium piriforme]|uniref:Uncharacterized protein n=2 Tax=Planctomicrobium piriforme TaxID=1576369 RepID=A0A1I3RLJ1_9PLAN|nr:hypothetical protein SAMN05421753_12111 [Planctomicrobium piriforme]